MNEQERNKSLMHHFRAMHNQWLMVVPIVAILAALSIVMMFLCLVLR